MTITPDYNLATLNAEAIAAICHRATVLRIWATPEAAASQTKHLDREFRKLAERLGYTVEATDRMTAPALSAPAQVAAE